MENNSKQNNSLIILLSILLFISLLVAGLFAYQTQQLVRELRVLRDELKQVPTTVPTFDPVANLKTYTNEKYKFSFSYPSILTIDEDIEESKGSLQLTFNKYDLPNNFIIKARTKYLPTDVHDLDGEPVETLYINGNKWDVYMLSAEDGYQIEKNKVLYTIIYPNSKKAAVDQILSTFKFLDDAPEATKIPLKTLKYSLPSDWQTFKHQSSLFEIGYDPKLSEVKTELNYGDQNSLSVVKNSTPYNSIVRFSLLPYTGGSRHQFIYNQIGETPTSGDLYKDYKELEYNISGKSCLILDGISISQYPVVWAMCAVGNKAVLMTTFDRNNYLSILQTLKIN